MYIKELVNVVGIFGRKKLKQKKKTKDKNRPNPQSGANPRTAGEAPKSPMETAHECQP